jgi:urea carboxylase-associated protein 2
MTSSPRNEHLTASVRLSQADARRQAGTTSAAMPYLPPQTSPYIPVGVDPGALVWAEVVAGGGYSHRWLDRGTRVRFDDVDGDACANILLYNAAEPGDRLNTADTQKISWNAYLRQGQPLLSGEGRALATIVSDDSGRSDALCGTSSAALCEAKYGASRPESSSPAGGELFIVAAAKHGLAPRDIPPSLSFFQGVHVESDGALTFTGSSGAGRHVDLLLEMPCLLLVANVPHPLDPRSEYSVTPLRIHAWREGATEPGSAQWDSAPETTRAYLNTQDYLVAKGTIR